jgi:hypothetical protein
MFLAPGKKIVINMKIENTNVFTHKFCNKIKVR